MLYLIDSYAWVEYFLGSNKGEVLRKLFAEGKNQFLTLDCCLAEIRGWALRNNQNFSELFKVIRANSRIISATEYDWIEAGQERFLQRQSQPDFGLIDTMLLIKQKEFSCEIISGDTHFKNLKRVLFLE